MTRRWPAAFPPVGDMPEAARSNDAGLLMISRTRPRILAPVSMWDMNTVLQSERIRTSTPLWCARRMARRDSSGIRNCPSSRSVETIASRLTPRRCISARMSLVTDTKDAGISSPWRSGSSSGDSSAKTVSPASAIVTVLSKSMSSSVLEALPASGCRWGEPTRVGFAAAALHSSGAAALGTEKPFCANHCVIPKRRAITGRTSSSSERDLSRGSTASRRKRSSGSLLNANTGMPLLGWWRNASGVSSTRTVLLRSLPSRPMSFTHG
mmetsp:Transcript_6426/g.15477  ORF Transcript_6426/g.15477 Transcript_6426/m.15477 type:complete len:267 (-) Transcript_6426:219-1019(-)